MRPAVHLGLAALLTLATGAYAQQTPAPTPASTPPLAQPSAQPPAKAPDATPAPSNTPPAPGTKPVSAKDSKTATVAKTDSLPSPGENLDPHIKAGSEDDVNAVGNRNIGGRGMGNWYSTNWE
ncbi:MAG TPA: hypothetical protein VNW54_11610, partial [Granulicella sp.]|nr:hypothetical protein [Granulicella sp.]